MISRTGLGLGLVLRRRTPRETISLPSTQTCHLHQGHTTPALLLSHAVALCLPLIHGVSQLQEPLGVPIFSHILSHLVLSHMHICSVFSTVTSTCTQALLFLISLSSSPLFLSLPSLSWPGKALLASLTSDSSQVLQKCPEPEQELPTHLEQGANPCSDTKP